jgi:hypothetical protein
MPAYPADLNKPDIRHHALADGVVQNRLNHHSNAAVTSLELLTAPKTPRCIVTI